MSDKRSSKAADMAARMKRAAGGPTADSTSADAAPTSEPAPAAPPVRTRPVRATVDLEPLEHRTLTRLRAELAERSGLATVAGADVFRALLLELDAAEREEPAGSWARMVRRLQQRASGRRA